MTLRNTQWLPPGSHSWCSEKDCGWTNLAQDCHKHGQTHAHLLGHIVHCYEAEPPEGWEPGTLACWTPHVSALRGPIACVKPRGHDGAHYAANVHWT